MNKVQFELVKTRKERNDTIKQLNKIVVQMDEKIRNTLPRQVSSYQTIKVQLSLSLNMYVNVSNFSGHTRCFKQLSKMVFGIF